MSKRVSTAPSAPEAEAPSPEITSVTDLVVDIENHILPSIKSLPYAEDIHRQLKAKLAEIRLQLTQENSR